MYQWIVVFTVIVFMRELGTELLRFWSYVQHCLTVLLSSIILGEDLQLEDLRRFIDDRDMESYCGFKFKIFTQDYGR
jgi:hypothetical protein